MSSREFFESFLVTFRNTEFDTGSRDVAEYLLLSLLRTMCSLAPQLYSICLQNKMINTLISPTFLTKIESSHWSSFAEGENVRVVNNVQDDLVTVFVRETLLDFIAELVKYGGEQEKLFEVSHLLNSLANEELDELCIIMVGK